MAMSCVGAQAGGPSSIGLVVGSGDRDRRVGEGGAANAYNAGDDLTRGGIEQLVGVMFTKHREITHEFV